MFISKNLHVFYVHELRQPGQYQPIVNHVMPDNDHVFSLLFVELVI